MTLLPDGRLRSVCRDIARRSWTEAEWGDRSTDGMFQLSDFGGGFDAAKGAFCLATYVDGVEHWFEFSLADAVRIAAGEPVAVQTRTGRSSTYS